MENTENLSNPTEPVENDEQKREKQIAEASSRRFLIWGSFIAASALLSVLLGVILTLINLPSNVAWIISGVAFFALVGTTIAKGYFETPHKHEDTLECLGEFVGKKYEAGPHIAFPYFNWEKIVNRTYLGQIRIDLFLKKNSVPTDVEFQDISAPVEAYMFIEVFDSILATYETNDVIEDTRKKAEHLLRSFFGVYKIEEAFKFKSFFNLDNVLLLKDISDDSPEKSTLSYEKLKELNGKSDKVKDSELYVALAEWGVKPVSLIISDIKLPEDVKAQRARLLTVEKDLEVADVNIKVAHKDAEIKVIKAKADAKQAALTGKGEADKLKNLMESGTENQAALDYLINKEKWNAVSVNPNATVIVGDGSKSSEGAQIGAGIGAVTKKNK